MAPRNSSNNSDDSADCPPIHHRVFLRALLLLLPMLSLLVIAGGIPYWLDRQSGERLLIETTGHLVDLQQSLIRQEVRGVVSDVRFLARAQMLVDFVSGRLELREAVGKDYTLFAAEKGRYDQIRYLDLDGMEVIRVNYQSGSPQVVAEGELQPKGSRYYFRNSKQLAESAVFVSPLDLNVEHREIERPLKPVIRFAAGVVDRHQQRQGVLVLNYLGERLLNHLDEVAASFSGNSWLVDERGYYIRGPQRQVEWNAVLGDGTRSFATDFPQAWKKISARGSNRWLSKEGLFNTRVIRLNEAAAFRSSLDADADADADANITTATSGPTLTVIAFMPTNQLHAGSHRLLQRLAWVGGPAAVLLCGLSWIWARAAEGKQNHLAQLTAARDELRKLASRLITAQEQERSKLSRELHDDLCQVLASVGVDLELAQLAPIAERQQYLDQALQGVQLVSEKVRQTAADVRTSLLDDVGLRAAIQELGADFESRHGLRCETDLEFSKETISPNVSEHIYRIVQESLTNVVRHAGTNQASVRLSVEEENIWLVVTDHGRGIPTSSDRRQGLGLLGIRERAELLGGTCSIVSSSSLGTRIEIVIPLGHDENLP